MSKTDYVVIDHHHDKEQGYYKITVGVPYETEEVETDSNGQPVQEEGRPVLQAVPNDDGTISEVPLLDGEGQPILGPGPFKMRTVVRHHSVEDFVFADKDKAWKNLSKEKVAEKQRAVIADALFRRGQELEKQAAAQAEAISSLPGAGEAL